MTPSLPPIRKATLIAQDAVVAPARSTAVHTIAENLSYTFLDESEVQKLRRENKHLVEELSQVSRRPREEVFETSRVKVLENSVVASRLDYNSVKHKCDCRRKQLQQLRSKLLEAGMLAKDRRGEATTGGGHVEAGKAKPCIQDLRNSVENKVAKVELDLLESESRTKTFQVMLRRLDMERQGLERAYSELQSERLVLCKQLEDKNMDIKVLKHEQTAIWHDTSEIEYTLDQSREKRKRLIDEQRKRASEQAQLDEYMSARSVVRNEVIQEVQGDLGYEEEKALQAHMVHMQERRSIAKLEANRMEKKVQHLQKRLEERFEDIGNVDKKWENIESFQNELNEKVKEKEGRKSRLEEDLKNANVELNDLHLHGVNISDRRRVIDGIERKCNATEKRLSKLLHQYNETSEIIQTISMGLTAISEKLENSKVRRPDDLEGQLRGLREGREIGLVGDCNSENHVLDEMDLLDIRLTSIADAFEHLPDTLNQDYYSAGLPSCRIGQEEAGGSSGHHIRAHMPDTGIDEEKEGEMSGSPRHRGSITKQGSNRRQGSFNAGNFAIVPDKTKKKSKKRLQQ